MDDNFNMVQPNLEGSNSEPVNTMEGLNNTIPVMPNEQPQNIVAEPVLEESKPVDQQLQQPADDSVYFNYVRYNEQ